MFNESVFLGPQGAPGRYGKPGRAGEYFNRNSQLPNNNMSLLKLFWAL